MSAHDFGLLTAHSGQDHFPSAFMQGYHPHQIYEHERYAPPSPVAAQTPLERYLHPMHGEVVSSVARDTYLPYDRRMSDPHPRTTYMQRQPVPGSEYPQSFEYTHNPISHSTLMHPPRGSTSAEHDHGLRPVVGFDPRPPHAGWTPKEEIDDEERTRELLTGADSMRSGARSPEDPQTSLLQSPAEPPRDNSHSPGHLGHSPPSAASKTYSFVSLPGNAVRKRPRRRYDEIERLYACSWPDCTKAYGTLNHLNAHVSMQRHGPKRSPAEFKELRKQWRQQKKQDTVAVSPPSDVQPTSTTSTGSAAVPAVTARRRRATESSLSLSLSVDDTIDEGVSAHPSHRFSLGDLRYPPHSDDDGNPLGPSPTSTTSDSVAYWQGHDSPVSPSIESAHQHAQTQSHASLHYPVAMQEESPAPLSPGNADDLPSPMNRLPPDSTLLTPLPGYRPPSPQLSRLGPASTLLQPLHASTLATLSPPHHPRSPVHPRGYEDYQDRQLHGH